MAPSPFHFFAGVREDILVGWQLRKWNLFGRSSLQSGRAGPSGVNVSRSAVRSLRISRLEPGECQSKGERGTTRAMARYLSTTNPAIVVLVTANPVPGNAVAFEFADDAIMIADARGIKRWVGGANTLELETWVAWILFKRADRRRAPVVARP